MSIQPTLTLPVKIGMVITANGHPTILLNDGWHRICEIHQIPMTFHWPGWDCPECQKALPPTVEQDAIPVPLPPMPKDNHNPDYFEMMEV